MHIKLAVIAALSYTTSAMSITPDGLSVHEPVALPVSLDNTPPNPLGTQGEVGTPVPIGASTTVRPLSIADQDTDDGSAPANTGLAEALAQVNETLDKMPNRDVLEWFEALRVDKWNRLAVDPPIDLNRQVLTIASNKSPVSGNLYGLIDGGEDENAVTAIWEESEFIVFFGFTDSNIRRVTGFLIESGPDHFDGLSPKEVTVSWDNQLFKPTKAVTHELNFTDEHQELYFDLPHGVDITDIRFTFKNDSGTNTEINQIELFGPSESTKLRCDQEIAAGQFVPENWWVYGPPAEAPDAEDQCVQATSVTTTSGCYVDSWVWKVPKEDCCQHAALLPSTRLDKAQLEKACI